MTEPPLELPSKEVVGLFWDLLPGFVAAWVYYGLTSHKKPSSFERLVQAFIFTAFVLPVRYGLKCLALWVGQYHSLGKWDGDSNLAVGVVVALFVGLVAAWCTNTSCLHSLLSENEKLKKLKLTKRTAFPSEWFSAFNRDKRYVYLHLTDKRRLHGWPEEFPDNCDSGHFILRNPSWVSKDKRRATLYSIERLLVPTTMVTLVEFHRWDHEFDTSPEEIAESNRLLAELGEPELESLNEVLRNGQAKSETKSDAESAD
jgi:hypothetical protein